MPVTGMFNQTTRRDPRYSGRRALNYRSMGGSTSGAAPSGAPAISEFSATPASSGGSSFDAALSAPGSGESAVAEDAIGDIGAIDTTQGFMGPVPDQNMADAEGVPSGVAQGVESGFAADIGVPDAGPGAPGVAPGEAPGVGVGVGGPSADAAPDGSTSAAGDGSAGGGGDGGCFITEATMAAGGQGDNDPTLEVLRQFRDQVMMANPVGQAMVQEYEMIAPIVVEAVSQRPDAMQIFAAIKQQYLDKAVEAIQQGDMNAAFQTYAEMMAFVTPFAVEAELGTGGDPDDRVQPGQEAIDDFGDTSAMAAYNPEMGHAATGGMEMDDPMADVGAPAGGLPPQPAGMPGFPAGPQGAASMPQPGGDPAIGQFVRRY